MRMVVVVASTLTIWFSYRLAAILSGSTLAGVVMDLWSYGVLCVVAGAAALALGAFTVARRRVVSLRP